MKELDATSFAHFCNQLYCRVMTRLLESDNQSAKTVGKAMEAFWDSPDGEKIIDNHWVTKSNEKNCQSPCGKLPVM